MTPRDIEVFDAAVDFIQRPADLSGAWGASAAEDLESRVRAANVIVIGTVRTIRTDTDAARQRTLRVVLSVEETMAGESPGDDLSLSVGEAEAGFDTVNGHDAQLLERRFIAMVKWAQGDAGSVVPRWHLSPASEANVTDVTRLLRQRRTTSSGN